MNPRIQELWSQANIRHVNDYALSGKPREEWRSVPDMFAELIVKECAKSLWTEECYYSDLALEEFEKNSNKIKQHFGIES